MPKLRLRRTGLPPLVFDGSLVSYTSGRLDTPSARERSRWHEIVIYARAGGGFVAKIAYHTTWPGEAPQETVAELATAADVARFVQNFDCTAYVRGFPPTPEYADRQAQLVAQIRADFGQLIGAALDCAAISGH